ncbi:MAG: TatD family deoxyribonuclease [Balneolaceae bacterium]|nr:MAG: TatD family deoxyribonuclease [Balneolaceae bacterium]
MNLTDTHCHLYLEQFHEDLEEVLNRAVAAGVVHIFLPAIDWKSLEQMDSLSHPEITFYKMAGIHPSSVEKVWPVDEKKLYEYCSSNDFVAVGETGLDYYWSTEFVIEQKKSLRLHCEVARQTGKPIILHNRDSTNDLLDIIEEEQDGRLTGVWHCFTGTADEGKRALDLGLYLGVGGVATFKNAGVDKVIRQMPPDRLLLETDSPYLAPAPHRGKRNEPSYIKIIAEKLAEITGMPTEEIAKITTDNAFRLFGIAHGDTETRRGALL